MLQKSDMRPNIRGPDQGPQLESKSETSSTPPVNGPFKIIKTHQEEKVVVKGNKITQEKAKEDTAEQKASMDRNMKKSEELVK
jgi:hypothetical protein